MRRDGETIIFEDGDDHEAFSQPASITVTEAMETASIFEHTAGVLDAAGVQLGQSDAPEAITRGQEKRARAGQLMGFATRIYSLCPEEHLTLILSQEAKNLS